ncbi:hypothetical protein NDU88_002313 [Pleurodeles waltl]|uniref:Uncharacterized protein n=1 Tax=Pleurodeles waltl TaxID=8319 RepID=A0AAV7P6D9_PLEWA|nr:hypothetical protein NDU88_002313 [Pleurodeles waltl]
MLDSDLRRPGRDWARPGCDVLAVKKRGIHANGLVSKPFTRVYFMQHIEYIERTWFVTQRPTLTCVLYRITKVFRVQLALHQRK